MCIGVFDGIVRKVVKRGWLRKDRGEGGEIERREKKERVRKGKKEDGGGEEMSSVSS